MYGHGDDLWRFNGASVGMGGHCLHSSRSDLIKVWEVFCKKPWSRMGSSPKCTVTETISGDSTEHQLAWEATVFIALDQIGSRCGKYFAKNPGAGWAHPLNVRSRRRSLAIQRSISWHGRPLSS